MSSGRHKVRVRRHISRLSSDMSISKGLLILSLLGMTINAGLLRVKVFSLTTNKRRRRRTITRLLSHNARATNGTMERIRSTLNRFNTCTRGGRHSELLNTGTTRRNLRIIVTLKTRSVNQRLQYNISSVTHVNQNVTQYEHKHDNNANTNILNMTEQHIVNAEAVATHGAILQTQEQIVHHNVTKIVTSRLAKTHVRNGQLDFATTHLAGRTITQLILNMGTLTQDATMTITLVAVIVTIVMTMIIILTVALIMALLTTRIRLVFGLIGRTRNYILSQFDTNTPVVDTRFETLFCYGLQTGCCPTRTGRHETLLGNELGILTRTTKGLERIRVKVHYLRLVPRLAGPHGDTTYRVLVPPKHRDRGPLRTGSLGFHGLAHNNTGLVKQGASLQLLAARVSLGRRALKTNRLAYLGLTSDATQSHLHRVRQARQIGRLN